MQRGFDNWDSIARRDDIDIFSTSIVIDYDLPLTVHRKIAEKTVRIAKAHGKIPQRWVMSYFDSPTDLTTIKEIVRIYAEAGVGSIFSWTYRAGQGTFLSAPEPEQVWKVLGEAYGEVLSR